MSTPQEMLRLYRAAAAVTKDILDCARQGDWDRVLTLGDVYVDLVEQIKRLGYVPPLDDDDRACKYQLLVDIMANDAATRNLALPSLEKLGALIGTMKRQQALAQAYGPAAAAAT